MLRSADVFLPILPFSERIIDLSGPSATRPLAHAAATRTRRLRARGGYAHARGGISPS